MKHGGKKIDETKTENSSIDIDDDIDIDLEDGKSEANCNNDNHSDKFRYSDLFFPRFFQAEHAEDSFPM